MNELVLRDGVALRLHLRGRGPALLLVHGFTGSSAAWGAGVCEPLARAGRLIAVDLPGHGQSDPVRDPSRYEPRELVADLCEVLDAQGIPDAVWIGYSMGGRLALAAAVHQPERVRALVLEGASPGLREAAERRARRAADEELARRLERDGIEAFVEHWMAQPLFASQAELAADLSSRERRRRLANDAHALAACLRGFGTGAQPSFWDALPGLRIPVLLLTGERDRKFRGIADAMAAALPCATRAEVAGAGHATHLENPPAFANRVCEFLDALSKRSEP